LVERDVREEPVAAVAPMKRVEIEGVQSRLGVLERLRCPPGSGDELGLEKLVEIGIVGTRRFLQSSAETLDRLRDSPRVEAGQTNLDRNLGAPAGVRRQLERCGQVLDCRVRVD